MEKKKVVLSCSECLKHNYINYKNKVLTNKVEFNKHCPHCNKHTLHIENR